MRFINPGWLRRIRHLAKRVGMGHREPWEKIHWGAHNPRVVARKVDVVFTVRNYYQIKELEPVKEGLSRKGIKSEFLDHSLDGNSPVAKEAHSMGLPVNSLRDFSEGRLRPGLLLVRTDSDKCSRILLHYGKKTGILTAAIAHPLINFQRKPDQFQLPDHVLCSGSYTASRMRREDVEVTGFPYFDRFLAQPEKSGHANLVLVNVALPRGLEHAIPEIGSYRKNWVNEALDASRSLGLDTLVSIHPRDTMPRFDWPVSPQPIEVFLPDAAVVVSPPSTVIFTALALGVPVACHQCPPLRQSMPDAFDEPYGAFRVSENLAELTQSIDEAISSSSTCREKSQEFFTRHISVIPERTMTERAVDAIIGLLG
jgi:hypothetical protein